MGSDSSLTVPRDEPLRPAALTPEDVGLPAGPARVRAKDPPTAHVRAKIDAQLRSVLSRSDRIRAGASPDDVHKMRVAIRRLRSVLKQSGGVLGPTAASARSELSWLGAALGEVRDLDVLIDRLRAVIAGFDPAGRDAGSALTAVFVAERAEAEQRLRQALTDPRYVTMLRVTAQLARRADNEPGAQEAPASGKRAAAPLGKGVRKSYRKFTKFLAALPEEPSDSELHALRIRCKRLRYAAEFARPAAKRKDAKRLKTVVKAAKALQSVLGEHQDAVVAADRMRTVSLSLGGELGFVAGRIAERELARRSAARLAWGSAARRVRKSMKKLR